MRNYTNVKVRISEGKKLKITFVSKSHTITIRLKFEDLNGEQVIAIQNHNVVKWKKLIKPTKAWQ